MSLKQIVLKNATTMSLHERFTKIRKNKDATASSDRIMQQLASNRNRRLAQQMEKRPSVAAALRRDSIKSRLGVPGSISVRDRLRFPRAFVARRGRGGLTGKSSLTRGIARATAMDVDTPTIRRRARSPFISTRIPRGRSRSRSRSRPPVRTVRTARSRSRSRARSSSMNRIRARSSSRSRYGSMLSLRGQFSGRRINYRRGRGGNMPRSRTDLKSFRPKLATGGPYRRRGGFRGRGRGRGRGSVSTNRGRGRGNFRGRGGGRGRLPTKEELDRDLENYMRSSKASLDKELDTMMTEESWD